MKGSCTSIHKSIREMHERTQKKGIDTVFDRYRKQQPQCGFGKKGVCCQLCSHGSCRITRKAEKGICGATADTIVARNLLRLAVHGAGAYSHQLEEALDTLVATAQGKTPYAIQDEEKLRQVAETLGINTSQSLERLALLLAQEIDGELSKRSVEPLALVKKFAPETRYKKWEGLGIVPGGLHREIRDALTRSMTSINTDPVDLLLSTMRLAIATGYVGLVASIILQDIILGAPQIAQTKADLGVLDENTVNIIAHGHVPYMAVAVLKVIQEENLQQLARDAGAEGIKLYGSMDTGQEILQRLNTVDSNSGFGGQLGNWITQEFMVATGACDLIMMDLNCSIPGLKDAADKFHTELVSVNRVLRMSGVENNVDYVPENVEEQARQLVKRAVRVYKNRSGDIEIPQHSSDVVAGCGIESLLDVLGGSLEPLLEAIQSGKIRGIAAVVGCTNNRNGHGTSSVALMEELIRRDILVISSGCVSSGAQIEGLMTPGAADCAGDGLREICEALGIPPVLNFGSCIDIGRIAMAVTAIASELGVDPSELPVAASAPEYLEQKAVVDGVFAIAFGLYTHLGPIPPVTGSELVTEVLTSGVEK